MIRYSLRCTEGHAFDGWFRDSAAFDAQAAAHQLACPQCGATDVAKALMAPSVVSSGAQAPREAAEAAQPTETHTLAADPRARALAEAMRRLRAHVEANADYVGERFPEEARRIHHEEAEHRNIYGEANAEDVRSLIEEGIEILPLPRIPEEGN